MIRQLYFWVLSLFKDEWTLSYDGEFGYELISMLPFAYWLHLKGKTIHTISAKDTDCLYYFSNHQSRFETRRYVRATGVPISNIHVRWLNTWMWMPPPLKEYYQNDRIRFDKPIYVICNKFNSEWGGAPISYLSIEVLDRLFKVLSSQFQVIYCRPGATDIVDDNSDVFNLDDHAFIRQNHPEVTLIQDLHQQHTDLSFNELQLLCFANANHFISVQGGYSIFCSYFKGTNLIYGARSKRRSADEIVYKAYDRWYHKFSGSKIIYCDSYDKIFRFVEEGIFPTQL